MIINHNIAALNTYRQLSNNSVQTNKALEKLSSGLRINKAGDDAAGLAISEKMRAQIRGLDQAGRNAQDAISLMQTAEGALNETHSILQRMRELAVQAATETNTDDDRVEIQKEINQLTSEINRIGNTTQFNTKNLLDGRFAKIDAASGVTAGATAVASRVSITSTPTQGSMTGATYGNAGTRAPKATATSFTGNIMLTSASEIVAGTNNELTLKVDDGTGKVIEKTITLTDGKMGASDVLNDFNDQLSAANLNAVATLDSSNRLTISSTTLGSSGYIEIVGGGFADSFLTDYSTNTGQVTNRGNSGDTFKVTLEGADGNTQTIQLGETVSTAANSATLFAQGANTAETAANIVDSLNQAIAADSNLAGRYVATTTGTGNDEVTIKATAASDGYAISAFTFTNNGGGLAGTAGTADDVTQTTLSTTGKDAGDVWMHDDVAASATGSIAFTDTALRNSALGIYADNNELTFILDGVEKTITMNDKVYDGNTTKGVGAHQAMFFDAVVTDTDTINVTLSGKALTFTSAAAPAGNYEFAHGADAAATATNLAAKMNLAIAADSDLAGKYQAYAEDNGLIVKALDTDGTVSGLAFTDTDTSGNTAVVELADAASAPAKGTKASNEFLLTAAFGLAAETFSIDLKDATDGSTKTITVTSHATDTDASNFALSAGDLSDQAAELVKSLNFAIAAAGLGSQYAASSADADGGADVGQYITIEAAAEGALYDVGAATITSAAGTGINTTNVDGIVNGVRASNTGGTVTANAAAGDTFKVTLKGSDGVNKELTLTATAGANSATTFTIGGDQAATAGNIRTALQMAIDADWRTAGRYTVSGTGAGVDISATDEGAAYSVSAVTAAGTTLTFGAGTLATGQTGETAKSLVTDLQEKINAQFKSAVTDTVTGVATAGDTYSISLEGYDGEMVEINLTAGTANSVTTWDASTATTEDNAAALTAALTAAIANNSQLAGRYTVVANGDNFTVTANGFGDGSRIAQSSERQVAIGSEFAVTNGAASDQQSLTVSLDSANNLVFTSNKTDSTSSVTALGSNLADDLFGAVETRNIMSRQDANYTLQLDIDGTSKSIELAQQTYQDLNEFISVNAAAFSAAGVTAFNEDGKLKLTSNMTGNESSITNVSTGDAAKQIGLVDSDGSALSAGSFVRGADGNTTLKVTVDGETVNAVIQEGDYSDRNVLAAAVQSAINSATETAADVTVTVNDDNELVITSGSTGATSKVVIGTHDTMDAAGILGLTSNQQVDGTDDQNTNLTFQIGANKNQSMSLSINDMRAEALGVSSDSATSGFSSTQEVTDGTNNEGKEYALNVTSTADASAAIETVDNAIKLVSAERSKLGASQNRLEHTINNLGTSSENLSSAESRIRDVDMAKEMMEFTKNNILTQAAQAMLAQANQQPQQVLQLLR